MTRRSNNWNAFETGTTGQLAIGATSVAVDSAAGLVAPIYMVIDPDDPTKREWIRVNSINANNLENIVRNLPGSVGDVLHEAGAKIRSVPTKQIFDDIFQDIEDDVLNLTQHETDGGDPHAQAGYLKQADSDALYVRLVGSTMTGPLVLFSDPTVAFGAATKQYVDTQSGLALPLAGGTLSGDLTMGPGAVVNMPQNFAFLNEADGTITAPASIFQDVAVLTLPESGTWMVWSSMYFADSVGGTDNIEYVAALFADNGITVIDSIHAKHNLPEMGANMFMPASPSGVYVGVVAGQTVTLAVSASLKTGAQDFKGPNIMALRIGP